MAAQKKSMFQQMKEAFKEYQPEMICGMLMMNGNSNVYALYKALKNK